MLEQVYPSCERRASAETGFLGLGHPSIQDGPWPAILWNALRILKGTWPVFHSAASGQMTLGKIANLWKLQKWRKELLVMGEFSKGGGHIQGRSGATRASVPVPPSLLLFPPPPEHSTL